MDEQESLIALNLIESFPAVKLRRLFDHLGSGKKILSALPEELTRVEGITAVLARKIGQIEKYRVEKELSLLKKHHFKVITINDKDYPQNLRSLPDAPLVLYVKGSFTPEDAQAVAIVGSRRASMYGISCARKFSRELAELGITVVSGMARGVDTASHEGALSVKGRTIAVLGSGLLNIYPPENKKLAEKIAQAGAVISEFPLETAPFAYNFPRRNRIISGISLGVVVAEAAKNSGALITAGCALEQGREVFAVPGKVDSTNSQGVNALIRQGAKLTANIEDILEELRLPLNENFKRARQESKAKAAPHPSLSAAEHSLLQGLSDSPVHLNELLENSSLQLNEVMSLLTQLELRRVVKQLPGKFFVKVN
ncbi:MAG: DNA-processing protein DprA [Candidatus Omnitrophota bacterium]